ncbi:MAG: hypothetical protein GSR85_01545, partial [Desulfurococcales archaeon]|nr:hypothetical protein [Desulfurococcales archaeon]
MSKKSGTNRILAILIDSTYLLPVFGIEVDGINSSDLLELRSLALKKKIKIHYSPISLIEVISKVAKESKKVEQGPTPEEIEATISIIAVSYTHL